MEKRGGKQQGSVGKGVIMVACEGHLVGHLV